MTTEAALGLETITRVEFNLNLEHHHYTFDSTFCKLARCESRRVTDLDTGRIIEAVVSQWTRATFGNWINQLPYDFAVRPDQCPFTMESLTAAVRLLRERLERGDPWHFRGPSVQSPIIIPQEMTDLLVLKGWGCPG